MDLVIIITIETLKGLNVLINIITATNNYYRNVFNKTQGYTCQQSNELFIPIEIICHSIYKLFKTTSDNSMRMPTWHKHKHIVIIE